MTPAFLPRARAALTALVSAPLIVFASLLAPAVPAAAQAPARYRPPVEQLPRAVPPQPVDFNHKLHTAAKIACLDCHPGAEAKERAGLPQREQCMLCHAAIAADRAEVRKLAALPAEAKIPWRRVYRVPDFVFFSHRSHAAASIGCARCHGPVETRETLAQEISTNMIACMNCHADRQASNECFLCHDLGQ